MRKTVKELKDRYEVIQNSLRSINDAVEADGRYEFTEEEEKNFKTLTSEASFLKRQIQVAAMSDDPSLREEALRSAAELATEYRISSARASAGAKFRDLFTSGARSVSADLLLRAAGETLSTDVAGSVAVTVGDVIAPLEKGLILGMLGIKMLSGLSGDYKYPILPYVEAKIENEAVKADSEKFDISSLTPNPKRLTITAVLSNWALQQSDMVLYSYVVNAITSAITRTLNRWMFQPSAIVEGVCGALAYNASSNPIHQKSLSVDKLFAGLLEMVGEVEATGAYNDGTSAFVVSAKMAAQLRSTPVAPGSDKMILSLDNKIAGFPVFFCEYIESDGNGDFNATAKNIGFGRWSDAQVAQFGNMRLTIDPYSRSREDMTEMTINANFSVDIIRPGSFVIGTIAS